MSGTIKPYEGSSLVAAIPELMRLLLGFLGDKISCACAKHRDWDSDTYYTGSILRTTQDHYTINKKNLVSVCTCIPWPPWRSDKGTQMMQFSSQSEIYCRKHPRVDQSSLLAMNPIPCPSEKPAFVGGPKYLHIPLVPFHHGSMGECHIWGAGLNYSLGVGDQSDRSGATLQSWATWSRSTSDYPQISRKRKAGEKVPRCLESLGCVETSTLTMTRDLW